MIINVLKQWDSLKLLTICILHTDEGPKKGSIAGTCTRMCPDAERQFRDRMRDIDSFEREQEGGPPTLAVKKFARNVSYETFQNFPCLILAFGRFGNCLHLYRRIVWNAVHKTKKSGLSFYACGLCYTTLQLHFSYQCFRYITLIEFQISP